MATSSALSTARLILLVTKCEVVFFFFPNTNQFSNTSWVSYNLTKF